MRKYWVGLKLLSACLLGLLISLNGSFLGGFVSLAQQPAQSSFASVVQQALPLLQQNSQLSHLEFSNSENLVQRSHQARTLYENGQYEEAIALWQQIAQTHAAQQNQLATASALSNLSISYQQLGQWDKAQASITESFALIEAQPNTPNTLNDDPDMGTGPVMARALMADGSLKMALGQLEQALELWQQAADTYRRSGDDAGYSRAQINQAQALRELGFYRQALEKLTQVAETMKTQPRSPLKAIALRRLGEALRLSGQLSDSETALTESLAIAQQDGSPADISTTLLSLGRTTQAQGKLSAAQDFYARAALVIGLRALSAQQVPIQLAQLALYIETSQWTDAIALWPVIQSRFEQLPPSRTAIYHQINWAESLLKLVQTQKTSLAPIIFNLGIHPNTRIDIQSINQAINQQLREAIEQARSLSDTRAEAYALGILGQLYEYNQQWAQAQDLTQQALALSTLIQATDITYQWQWQLGRLWSSVDNPQRSIQHALEAYDQAIVTLSQLRGDLTAANHSSQFSFQENVEPIYRQFASLLLQSDPQAPNYLHNLAKAQGVIESLRLAELENYFSEACIDIKPIDINQVDPNAGIVYTLVLEDRLSVILHLPNQPLQHFSTAVSHSTVNDIAAQLRQQLVIRSRREYLPLAKQLYSWLIAPARPLIDTSGVKTLIFVLDGPLQNVPMAALYDGDRFLIEDYAVGLTPGLKLLNPKPWRTDNLSALITAMSESRRGLAPLPYVEQEIESVSRHIGETNLLLNSRFTQAALSQRLKATAYPIVHVATHGQLGSTPEETYLVAWDELINVRDVSEMLQVNLGSREEGIELLVLSACETASGDQQAALGLAGVAIKAGARSTLGTLWAINDEATAYFIDQFYEQLTQAGASRAGALRKAQLQLLHNPQYQHPIYWAPYVLLGSWL